MMKCCICGKERLRVKGQTHVPQGYRSTLLRIGIDGEKVHVPCLQKAITAFNQRS